MIAYARVRAGSLNVILRDPSEIHAFGVDCLTGIEVDRHGTNVGTDEVSERRHVIQLATITRRTPMQMSNQYGTLEPTKENTP